MTNSHTLAVERRFVAISRGESLERSSRLRELLLVGAKRLAQGQCKAVVGLEAATCN
jgi:hypothetical protein